MPIKLRPPPPPNPNYRLLVFLLILTQSANMNVIKSKLIFLFSIPPTFVRPKYLPPLASDVQHYSTSPEKQSDRITSAVDNKLQIN